MRFIPLIPSLLRPVIIAIIAIVLGTVIVMVATVGTLNMACITRTIASFVRMIQNQC